MCRTALRFSFTHTLDRPDLARKLVRLAYPRKLPHFAILEVWSGEIAFDRHVASDHARSARAKLQPLLASPFDDRTFKLVE